MLDVTSLEADADSNLNYDSPAVKIEMESSTGAGLASPLTYFTMRPATGYGTEFKALEETDNTVFCSLQKETSWTFGRAVPEDLESSITVVFSIVWIVADVGDVWIVSIVVDALVIPRSAKFWRWCNGINSTEKVDLFASQRIQALIDDSNMKSFISAFGGTPADGGKPEHEVCLNYLLSQK